DEFKKYSDTYVASEDGCVGTKGNVLDAVREFGIDFVCLCACGPMPMLRAIKEFAGEKPAFISLEERMACGVGACLGCVVKTAHEDAHSHVNNARICTDGPVFEASEVEI
ncbi:MAG: dihydroorotate dehydrogenase electron transfer subunit, partial [Lachnospiraceae bacterium]|nr:dihydroorotate dehydrogenase electron transfer subunit [Lachnospiraceae bacterium]